MKTTRIILQVPFYKHPAGTVFEVAETTEPAEWPEEERVREKLDFGKDRVYHLPDGGRGFAVSLPVSETAPCPEHIFEEQDVRKGACRITLVGTHHGEETGAQGETSPCGQLREEDVSIVLNPAVESQGFLINLPPFEAVAEKMVLLDSLRGEQVLEYPQLVEPGVQVRHIPAQLLIGGCVIPQHVFQHLFSAQAVR